MGFVNEISELLSFLVLKFDRAIITGKIHTDNSFVTDFLNISKPLILCLMYMAPQITAGTFLT